MGGERYHGYTAHIELYYFRLEALTRPIKRRGPFLEDLAWEFLCGLSSVVAIQRVGDARLLVEIVRSTDPL